MLPSMWRKKPLYTAAGNVIWYSWYGSQYGAPPSPSPSCKQLKIDLEYDGLYHSLVYTQRTLSTSETLTHPCLFLYYSQQRNGIIFEALQVDTEMWHIHTAGFSSTVKSEIMMFVDQLEVGH